MSEEFTLDSYVQKQKDTDGGPSNKDHNKGNRKFNNNRNFDNNNNGGNRNFNRNNNNNSNFDRNRNNSNFDRNNNNNNNFKNRNNNNNYNRNRNDSDDDNFNKRGRQQQRSQNRDDSNDRSANRRSASVKPVPEHKKRIVKVYNLVPSITNEDFYNLFVKYGMIESSQIETDKKGKSEERGFVVYRDHAAAKLAIDDLHRVELEGRIITVEFLKDGEKLTNMQRIQSDNNERSRSRKYSSDDDEDNQRRNGRNDYSRGGNRNNNNRDNRPFNRRN